MSSIRRKMCEHCAFRCTSAEMKVPELREYTLGESMHRTFHCHETMFQKNPDETKWLGEFDPARKRDGSQAEAGDHQVCAGFALMFGEELGYDVSGIPTENHEFKGDKNAKA